MSDKTTIWVLEDDSGMQFAYQQLLEPTYNTVIFGSLAELTTRLGDGPPLPSLLIADLGLPDGSFLDSLRGGLVSGVPCVVVSSVDDMAVLRSCFQMGATDYLTKPFSPAELALKVERVLASAEPQIVMDVRTFDVSVQGRGSATLTGKEFQILSVLYQSKNRTASRTELLQRVWGTSHLETKALDVHMHNLRRKIAPLGLKVTHRRPVDYILERDDD